MEEKPKRGKGRPVVHNVEETDYQKIEAMAGLGLKLSQISSVLGMSKATLERKASDDPKIYEALEKGRAKALAQVSKTCYELASSGKVPAMTMFYLKCRGGWSEKSTVEISGINGGAIKVELTPEERVKRLEELEKRAKQRGNT